MFMKIDVSSNSNSKMQKKLIIIYIYIYIYIYILINHCYYCIVDFFLIVETINLSIY